MPETMMLPFTEHPTLRLEMLSDWHVGSGTGRPGNIDRLVIRDEDGLPYVPAKTLVGIWRDAAERLAFGLDGGEAGRWTQWVKHLFGDQPARGETGPIDRPRPSALSIRSARFAESLRSRLRGTDSHAKSLQAALTFVKPGVKIDSRNGRALDDHLRFEEMARMRAVLNASFSVTLPEDPTQRNAVIAFLVSSTQLVERLGGKRRRGAGRCRLTIEQASLDIEQASLDAALAWLESNQQPPDPPVVPELNPLVSVPRAETEQGTEWKAIPFVVELSGPLAVSSRTVGNVVESLDYVPGTFLLRHFTAALERSGIADVRQAIMRGDLRVMPATVEVDGEGGRPVPFALFQRKDGGSLTTPETLVNRLLERNTGEDPQLKQCRSGYLGPTPAETMPAHRSVDMTLRTHNTVDEERQRPTTEVGGVYSYEAISAKRLRGELRIHKSLYDRLISNPTWKASLGGRCRLGRSKKDDYGDANLEIGGNGSAIGAALPCCGRQLMAWVVTDVLLRDERLRPAPTPEALRRELGRLLEVTLTKVGAFSRVRRIESWNVSWCLPRPSLIALQAGTTLVFELPSELDGAALAEIQNRLSEIEARGLGERTAEGYGLLRFNDPLLLSPPRQRKPPVGAPPPDASTAGLLSPRDPAYSFAERIEEEVWREAVRRAALSESQGHGRRRELLGWHDDHPPMSQLGGLRGVVQQVRSWESRSIVLNWLDHLRNTQRRADKWSDALAKTRRLFEQRAAVWEILNPADWPTLTRNAGERLKDLLWPWAVRTLIDACIRAHKRQLDERERRH